MQLTHSERSWELPESFWGLLYLKYLYFHRKMHAKSLTHARVCVQAGKQGRGVFGFPPHPHLLYVWFEFGMPPLCPGPRGVLEWQVKTSSCLSRLILVTLFLYPWIQCAFIQPLEWSFLSSVFFTWVLWDPRPVVTHLFKKIPTIKKYSGMDRDHKSVPPISAPVMLRAQS